MLVIRAKHASDEWIAIGEHTFVRVRLENGKFKYVIHAPKDIKVSRVPEQEVLRRTGCKEATPDAGRQAPETLHRD